MESTLNCSLAELLGQHCLLSSFLLQTRAGPAPAALGGPLGFRPFLFSPHSVPSPLLIKKFSDTSKAFMNIMSAQASTGSTSALRWVSVWVCFPSAIFRAPRVWLKLGYSLGGAVGGGYRHYVDLRWIPMQFSGIDENLGSFPTWLKRVKLTDSDSPFKVLSCLATLLRKQDLEAWSYPVTLQVYHGLLSFTVHSKPKVRLLGPRTWEGGGAVATLVTALGLVCLNGIGEVALRTGFLPGCSTFCL